MTFSRNEFIVLKKEISRKIYRVSYFPMSYFLFFFFIKSYHFSFQMHRDWMAARAKKTTKMEKKLKIKLGGYAVSWKGKTEWNAQVSKFPHWQGQEDFLPCEKETNGSAVVKMGHLVTSIFRENTVKIVLRKILPHFTSNSRTKMFFSYF